MDESDRRDSPRAPIELRVEYKRLNSFFADYTKNISHGGTFIRTDKPLEIGTDFIFKLGVPGLATSLELKGKVQWVITEATSSEEQEAGMGIGFIFESEADRERVINVVEGLMRESLGQVLLDKLMARNGRS